jgi:hypothetical protein
VTIRLADPEATVLEGFGRRQLAWDASLPARVISSGSAVGLFTCPPMGVLVFFAVPALEPISDDDRCDVLVPLARFADLVRDHGRTGLDPTILPRALVPPGPAPSLHHLPPADGWQLPIHGVAGDLVPKVEEATREFEARSAGLPPRSQETVAEEIWERPGFGGLPLRALHAARRLGMIANDRSRVAAATCGPWKRLSTPRGQVFVYASGPAARLSLHVVR